MAHRDPMDIVLALAVIAGLLLSGLGAYRDYDALFGTVETPRQVWNRLVD